MAPETCLDYDQLKSAVLRAYELVPEAYRQKFRRLRKRDGQTFCEFGREKEALFDRWCQSTAVLDFKDLRNLVLLEEFKNCLPENICTYLNEQKVKTVADAAVLAEEYVLRHRENERSAQQFKPFMSQSRVQFQGDEKPRETSNWKGKVCFYCKKPGHTINQCFVLNKKSKTPKSVTLVQTGSSPVLPVVHSSPSFAPVTKEGLDSYTPFLMDGFVSLSEHSSKVPVTILRDSGASQSVLLEGVLLLSDSSFVRSSALIRGIGMNFIGLPLHAVFLESSLVKGLVVVGVRSKLPVEGVSFILGNDLAEGKILLNPEVITVPLTEQPDELQKKFPNVFSVCAVTRAMAAKEGQKASDSDVVVDLAKCFSVDNVDSPPLPNGVPDTSAAPVELVADRRAKNRDTTFRVFREQLIVEQKRDVSPSTLFELVVSGNEADVISVG